MIAEFLAEKKQKQIACLMGDQNASTTRDRLRGILSRSGELGLRIDQVEYGQYTYESGSEMCRKLLK